MINEIQFNDLLLNKIKSKNNKTFFGSPLKKFINNIYNKLDIPEESFVISLYYLNKFYKENKNNFKLIDKLFQNINLYIFTTIIIALKQILDFKFNIKIMATMFDINYDYYISTELIILKSLNWDTFYNDNDITEFKKLMVRYMD